MNICIPHDSKTFQGGGSQFINNLKKSLKKYGYRFFDSYNSDCDYLFISGASLCDKETAERAKAEGKKIILRVDNLLEDRKNRNSGMSRMIKFAEMADVIIYQSEWAEKMLSPLLGKGIIIINGVDTEIFYPREKEKTWDNIRIFYSKFSRSETKQFHEVQYWWREYNLEKQDDILILVGRFADDYRQIAHPFDFHNDEQFSYKGVITDQRQVADIMRECDVAFLPYQFDACSNTILECQACGLPIIYSKTGGTPELVEYGYPIDYDVSPVDMVKFVLGQKKTYHKDDFEFKFGLETMGEKYNAVLTLLSKPEYDI